LLMYYVVVGVILFGALGVLLWVRSKQKAGG
jgi:hypothetical protein